MATFPRYFLALPASPSRLTRAVRIIVFAVIFLGSHLGATVDAANGLKPGDEFWLLSTRCLNSQACRIDLDDPQFQVYQYDDSNQFSPRARQQLTSEVLQRADCQTVIYVHGNRFDANEAVRRGWYVYQQIRPYRHDGKPVRFIVWSWPSDAVPGVLKDVELKAARTDAQGLYLAWFLREIVPTPNPISIIGYSFGGRVTTGALHALAGGSLGGRTLPGPHVQGANIKIGLVAAAVNQDWLRTGHYHGMATANIQSLSIMFNPRDTILKRYWLLEPGSDALGAVGPLRLGYRFDGSPVPVDSHNCSSTVGRHHDETDYFSQRCRAGCVFARMLARGAAPAEPNTLSPASKILHVIDQP